MARKRILERPDWMGGDVYVEVDDPIQVLADIVDAGTQIITSGQIGFDKKGYHERGGGPNDIQKAWGRISGNDAVIEAQKETRDALTADAAAKAKELKGEQTRKMQQDIQASQTAGALRRTASAQQRNSLGASNFTQDFLGV